MPEIQTLGETRDIVVVGDRDETLKYSAEHFIRTATNAIKERGLFTVALSGGSTPKGIYTLLAAPQNRSRVDWSKVMLFWSDERSVGPDHPDSNYKMAMDAAFSHIGVPSENIFRMVGESRIEQNAQIYEKIILEKVPEGSFDLIMLGMGDDGHTASLFPRTHGLQPTERLVVANFIPSLETWRLTLTYECINNAKEIVIYVLGKSKSSRLNEVLTGPYRPNDLPIQKIGTPQHRAFWIVDKDAGSAVIPAKN